MVSCSRTHSMLQFYRLGSRWESRAIFRTRRTITLNLSLICWSACQKVPKLFPLRMAGGLNTDGMYIATYLTDDGTVHCPPRTRNEVRMKAHAFGDICGGRNESLFRLLFVSTRTYSLSSCASSSSLRTLMYASPRICRATARSCAR